ncbi:hypothetical protein PRIPAC_89564, partial [Pristionchus pacificus]|uniref:Uncharacterized protein n=1 Tax=Pristionchus pacificus TaxID=54126 RepID=A0A2A6CVJ1_PRIPA
MLMTKGIVILLGEVPLAPDDVTSSRYSDPICTEVKIAKNLFRRDVIWSQRDFAEQNDYSHRHQHAREPLLAMIKRFLFLACAGFLRICSILTQRASYASTKNRLQQIGQLTNSSKNLEFRSWMVLQCSCTETT